MLMTIFPNKATFGDNGVQTSIHHLMEETDFNPEQAPWPVWKRTADGAKVLVGRRDCKISTPESLGL